MVSIEKILADKREEIERLRKDSFIVSSRRARPRYSFLGALKAHGLSVIAEIKRSSPSTGEFGIEPLALRDAYLAARVDALSILTDRHFGMSRDDFRELGSGVEIPILRKDFILAREQITEADLMGADAILLIATFLPAEDLESLGAFADSRGLDVLYEIHSEAELSRLPARARLIGVNNRNLSSGDYQTSLSLSAAAVEKLPPSLVKVAESGYEKPGEVPAGYDAVLIGGGMIREWKQGGDLGDFVRRMKAGGASV